MLKIAGMIMMLLLLAACGAKDDNKQPAKKPMLDKERQTLGKARQVDSVQQQAAEQLRKQVEQQSQ